MCHRRKWRNDRGRLRTLRRRLDVNRQGWGNGLPSVCLLTVPNLIRVCVLADLGVGGNRRVRCCRCRI